MRRLTLPVVLVLILALPCFMLSAAAEKAGEVGNQAAHWDEVATPGGPAKGWSVGYPLEMTEDLTEAFRAATANVPDAVYEPVAYLGCQGNTEQTMYAFLTLCYKPLDEFDSPDGKPLLFPYYEVVYIRQDVPSGAAEMVREQVIPLSAG